MGDFAGDCWQRIGLEFPSKRRCKLAWGGSIVPCWVEGSFPTSFGYTQFHVDGGLGTGIASEVLLDGVTNFRLAAQHIRGDLAAGNSLYDALWPWTARPQIWVLYQRILVEGIEGVSNGGGNGRNGGGKIPVSSTLVVPILALLAIWIVVN
mgnify:CR=1 FL=1